jgi:hypothetical protein
MEGERVFEAGRAGRRSLSGTTLLLRPGALGDAVLTLPALGLLAAAGAERLLILGTARSWGFLRADSSRGLSPAAGVAPEVLDAGDSKWLGLFGAGAELDPRARSELRGVSRAVVYLPDDDGAAGKALSEAGVPEVLRVDPPRRESRGAPHAAWRLAAPLLEWLDARRSASLLRAEVGPRPAERPTAGAGVPERLERFFGPWLAPARDECAAALAAAGFGHPPERLLAIHPGSGGKAKCWPREKFVKLAEAAVARGFAPLVLTGPAEEEAREALRAEFRRTGARFADSLPLRQVAALLGQSRAYVGNDSGVTHLAARLTGTVAIFGPTDAETWRPLGGRVRISAGEAGGMEAVGVDEVLEAVQEVSGGASGALEI